MYHFLFKFIKDVFKQVSFYPNILSTMVHGQAFHIIEDISYPPHGVALTSRQVVFKLNHTRVILYHY